MARAGRKPTEFFRPDFRDYIIDEMFDGDFKKCRLSENNREQFEKLSWAYFDDQPLIENREIAKRMGVESPSTMPKEELLRHMIAERWGMQYLANNGVLLSPVDMSLLDAKDEMELIEDNVHGDVVMGEYFEGTFDGNECGGVLRVNRFTKSMGDVGVIRRLVNYHGIKAGDYVSGWGRYVPSVNFFCLFCIDKVNGTQVGLPSDKNITPRKRQRDGEYEKYLSYRENLIKVAPTERLKFSGKYQSIALLVGTITPIALGQSLIVSSENKFNPISALFELSNAIDDTGVVDEVITLCLEEPIEQPDICGSVVVTMPDDNLDSPNVVERARGYAVSQAKSGRKMVILLNSLARTGSEINAKKLLSSAVRYENGGSVTIIAFADCDDKGSYYYGVRHLVSAELKIVTRPFMEDYSVCLQESHSDLSILTETDIAVRKKLADMADKKGNGYVTSLILKSKNYDDIVKRILAK